MNSLSDEMFQCSWSCLRIFGRFVDIGKKHFVANAFLGLKAFDRSITYTSVDLALLIEHRGPYVQRLADMIELFDTEVLKAPKPVHRVPISDVAAAFRAMQSGKVVEKTVIVNDAASVINVELHPKLAQIRGDVSYLVTGRTGGLGRVLARWLIEKGAKHVVLVSRSGRD